MPSQEEQDLKRTKVQGRSAKQHARHANPKKQAQIPIKHRQNFHYRNPTRKPETRTSPRTYKTTPHERQTTTQNRTGANLRSKARKIRHNGRNIRYKPTHKRRHEGGNTSHPPTGKKRKGKDDNDKITREDRMRKQREKIKTKIAQLLYF